MKKIFSLLFIIPIIVSCKHSKPKEEFSIEGKLINASGQQVKLSELEVRKILPLDSMTIDQQGGFRFDKPLRMKSFFILNVGNNRVILVPGFGEKISITGDATQPGGTWVISGSEDSEILQDFFRKSSANVLKADSLQQVLHQHENKDDMLKISRSVDSTFGILMTRQKAISRQAVESNPKSLANLIILNFPLGSAPVLDPQEDFDLFNKVDSLLLIEYPDNQHVAFHHQRLEAVRNLLKLKNDLVQPQKK